MSKLICPHCERHGITLLRKLFLGPAVPATCKECGRKIGVPYVYSLLAFIPGVVAIFGLGFVDPFAIKAAILVGGVVVVSLLQVYWVPLARR